MEVAGRKSQFIWIGLLIVVTGIVFFFVDLTINKAKFFEVMYHYSFLTPFSPFAYIWRLRRHLLYFPILEEMLFREGIYILLKKRTKYANIIQSVLFSSFHFCFLKFYVYWQDGNVYSDFVAIFLAFILMGLILGWVEERTGSTEACIFFHSLYLFSFLYIGSFYPINAMTFIEKMTRMRVSGHNTLIHSFLFHLVLWLLLLIKVCRKENILFPRRHINEGNNLEQ